MTGLFRQEALAYAARRLDGAVMLVSPLPARVLAVAAIVLVGGAATFAATATYARKEIVAGWLVPSQGLIRVNAGRGGVVDRLAVSEGDTIPIGRQMADLRLPSSVDGGRDAFSTTQSTLAVQVRSQLSETQSAIDLLNGERGQLATRGRLIQAQLTQAEEGIAFQRERIALAEREAERGRVLAQQGLMASRELDSREATFIAARQSLNTLNAGRLALQRDAADVDARLGAIPKEIAAARARSASSIADLDQRSVESQASSRYIVASTIAGQVVAIPIRVGENLAPGTTVAIVAPTGSPLEAELYAPSRAAGFVKPGQEVRLMYQAFPHQKFGTGSGVIVSVSRAALAPSEVNVPGLSFNEAVFKVKVRLRRESIDAYGAKAPLRPGMLLSANIILERRSLLEWLLDPLYAAGRGF